MHPSQVAVAKGEVDLCEELLSRGARPSSRPDESGNTSLHVAVIQRSERLVRLLLNRRAETSLQNRDGATPLLIAASTGQTPVVSLLLSSAAGLHQTDGTNRSGLELALENGHLDTLRVLLSQVIRLA